MNASPITLRKPRVPKRLFIFHGEALVEAEEHLKKTIVTALGPQREQANIVRFYGDENALEAIGELASTPPLFTKHTFLVFQNYDKVRDKKNLVTLVENLHEKNFLYLIKPEKKFHNTNFEGVIRKLAYAEVKVQFFLDESTLRHRIQKAFRSAQLQLEPEALDYLCHIFVNEPLLLKNELEKCLTYFTEETSPIRVERLAKLIAVENIYLSQDVIDAIFSKSRRSMLKRLLIFLENEGNLVELINFLIKETQKIINYHEERKRGLSDSEIFTRIHIFYKKHQQVMRQRANRFSLDALERFLMGLLEIDETLKSQTFTSGLLHSQRNVNQKAKCQLERTLMNLA